MAIFQGENKLFTVIIRDENNNAIPTAQISSISAKVYNESSGKVYLEYSNSAGNTGPTDRLLVANTEDYELVLHAVDTTTLPSGRYIIQITYSKSDSDFTEDGNNKIVIEKGALISILEAK